MLKREDIKNYKNWEDIEKDYESFRSDWEYDRQQARGVHKSGLILSRESIAFEEKVKYDHLPEWTTDAISSGLSETEAKQYL